MARDSEEAFSLGLLTDATIKALVWAYFEHKRAALQLGHNHLDRKILKGKLKAHIHQPVDGKKQFEEAMKQNMKLGLHSEAHKVAVRRRVAAAVRERGRIPA